MNFTGTPICWDCKHRRRVSVKTSACMHPDAVVDDFSPVSGWKRSHKTVYQMRAAGSHCGPEGFLFLPAEKPATKPGIFRRIFGFVKEAGA